MKNTPNSSQQLARVAILMGSDSDWEVLQGCRDQLSEFGIRAEVNVLSAHRTPDELHAYVREAPQRGIAVFIAAAGMSAALAGTIAAHTTLPVIGVPIDSGSLRGLDALLSTVQMPPGVPVATMAVGAAGARNAAIFAAQILAIGDTALAGKLHEFKRAQTSKVLDRNCQLQEKLQQPQR